MARLSLIALLVAVAQVQSFTSKFEPAYSFDRSLPPPFAHNILTLFSFVFTSRQFPLLHEHPLASSWQMMTRAR